ncbi:hypothetical protein [Vibrio hepatarius]|uniref:hypothetical protein n=1 Tax=Vibrio hepatarius TaxID=171383 RepID=UPI001C0A3B3D|nr:hypothetical protein [Vibrio hepatarius]MBU2895249.1 hypothetical protein [Vibrio hepatarius]
MLSVVKQSQETSFDTANQKNESREVISIAKVENSKRELKPPQAPVFNSDRKKNRANVVRLDDRALLKNEIQSLSKEFDVQIARRGFFSWELTSDLYSKVRVFDSLKSLKDYLQDNYSSDKALASNIEQAWGVEITRSSNTNYPWKVSGGALEQSFRFPSLEKMKQALQGGFLKHRAKHMVAMERMIRGRDVHNVTSFTPNESGPVLVIDGGDDLAVSLENSGLPRSLVLAAQSTLLYPVFAGVVFTGWKGAKEESDETREAYSDLKAEQNTLREDIGGAVMKALSDELVLKEQLINAIDKNQIENIQSALLEQLKFKANVLESVQPILKSGKQADGNLKTLTDSIATLKQLKEEVANHNQVMSTKADLDITVLPENVQKLLTTNNQSQLFDPSSPECHEFLQQVAKFKANQDDKVAKFADAYVASAFTESGLSGMYWGMISFEARATIEALAGTSVQTLTNALSQVGDAFNVVGQAQMVVAGLTKTALGIHEAKSLNDWLDQIRDSKVLDSSDKDLTEVKGILSQFNRHQRNVVIAETLGNSVLTLGQLGMILGGPLGTGIAPVLYAGVGATIGGVGLSQIAAQYSNKVFEVSDEKSDKEKEIGRWSEPGKTPFEVIQRRIKKLYELSQDQALPKVWLNIFQTAVKNPDKNASEILQAAGKPLLKYGEEHSGHYRKLYREAFDKINADNSTLDVIEKAKQALNKQDNYTGFSAFVAQHIAKQQNIDIQPQNKNERFDQIDSLFKFAEEQGFANDFERRIVKRLTSKNGYLGKKEGKVDSSDYISVIEANKSKKPWQIPNPIAPAVNLYRLAKQLIKPIVGREFMSSAINIPGNWGHKDTSVYVFNRDKFLADLESSSDNSAHVDDVCRAIFTPQMTSEVKNWVGKDNRHVFEESMRKIGKQTLRDNVLRPIVHGASEQIKLADQIESLQ